MDRKTKALFREIMREIGRKGGKIGGKRSLETMTPEQRSAREKGGGGSSEEAEGRAAGEGARDKMKQASLNAHSELRANLNTGAQGHGNHNSSPT